MNKYRESNIELLEAHMNKTLAEGCIVEYNSKLWKIYKCDHGRELYCLIDFDGNTEGTWINSIHFETIGHYTLDAALRCIKDKKHLFNERISPNYIYFCFDNTNCILKLKPLHLYTEQEDKELNEVLLYIS